MSVQSNHAAFVNVWLAESAAEIEVTHSATIGDEGRRHYAFLHGDHVP